MPSDAPFIPDCIKEPRQFYDRKRGLMLLGKRENGELWLFRHNVEQDCWTSVRRATAEDVEVVNEVMRT